MKRTWRIAWTAVSLMVFGWFIDLFGWFSVRDNLTAPLGHATMAIADVRHGVITMISDLVSHPLVIPGALWIVAVFTIGAVVLVIGAIQRGWARFRLLAAASSIVAVFSFAAIYSSVFASYFGNTGAARNIDIFVRRIASFVVSGDIPYHPKESWIPFALAFALATVRAAIYFYVTRSRDEGGSTSAEDMIPDASTSDQDIMTPASLIGSVYWSHISALVLVTLFLLQVAHWSPLAVAIALSSVALMVLLLRMRVVKNLVDVVFDLLVYLFKSIHELFKLVAAGSIAVAVILEDGIGRARKWYKTHVGTPVTTWSKELADKQGAVGRGASKSITRGAKRAEKLVEELADEEEAGPSAE
jgi:hypothetical protein